MGHKRNKILQHDEKNKSNQYNKMSRNSKIEA